jgi:restriction system protein
MAVPDFQTVMRPVLVALEDEQPKSPTAIRSVVADEFSLTAQDLEQEIPSGRAKTFHNRVGWAITYLFRTGLISRPARSTYQLTDRGKTVLANHPTRVDLKVLSQFDEFNEFNQSKAPSYAPTPKPEEASDQTPEEQIDHAYGELHAALTAEVLDRVHEKSPDFFELLVLDVLHAMGMAAAAAPRLTISARAGTKVSTA